MNSLIRTKVRSITKTDRRKNNVKTSFWTPMPYFSVDGDLDFIEVYHVMDTRK